MASFQRRDLAGGTLSINGKQIVDQNANITAHDAQFSGNVTASGTLSGFLEQGGTLFTEFSPQVSLMGAPGISAVSIVFGASFLQKKFAFGSLGGVITVTAPGPQTIVITGPGTSVFGVPVEMQMAPLLMMIAINGTVTYPVSVAPGPTLQDITLSIFNITPGNYNLTTVIFSAVKI
jgi:hypothetical protein